MANKVKDVFPGDLLVWTKDTWCHICIKRTDKYICLFGLHDSSLKHHMLFIGGTNQDNFFAGEFSIYRNGKPV